MLPLAASVPINPAKLVLTSDISAQANEAVCAKWMGLLLWQWFPDDHHYLDHNISLSPSLRAMEKWRGLNSAENN